MPFARATSPLDPSVGYIPQVWFTIFPQVVIWLIVPSSAAILTATHSLGLTTPHSFRPGVLDAAVSSGAAAPAEQVELAAPVEGTIRDGDLV
ncbi:MAG TPA: hypothetical protein DDY91_07045 [Planctomycetaceae bacterium]|nr:hypothetical protein [Planctomycetaceae bacterium]